MYSEFTPHPSLTQVPTHGPKPRRSLVERKLGSEKWFMKPSIPSSLNALHPWVHNGYPSLKL